MQNNNHKLSLIRTIFVIMIVSVFLLILSISIITIYRSLHIYRQEAKMIHASSMEEQKTYIKNQVEKIAFYVRQMIYYNEQLSGSQKLASAQLQDMVLNVLVNLRYNREGYFYGSTYNGDPLFSNGVITKGTESVLGLTDPNGVKIIQGQLKAIDKPEGVFLEYYWNKLNETKLSPKITYTIALPEWNWILGTGVYLDDVNKIIEDARYDLQKKLFRQINEYILLLLLYILISYMIIKKVSAKIKNNINSLTESFIRAADNYETINLEQLNYPEFISIAKAANTMIARRKAIEEALSQSEHKYRQLINTTSEGFWMLDAQLNIIEINDSFAQMMQTSRDDLLGQTPLEFMDKSNCEKFKKIYFTNGEHHHHHSFEIELIKINDESLPCFVKATKLYDDNHKWYATFAFLTDITDRKNYEQKLNKYRFHLEEIVQERTADLEIKNKELQSV